MKSILLLAVCMGIVAILSLAQAYPQRSYTQNLEFYSPATRLTQPIRIKRAVSAQNSVTTNPTGGQDVSLSATKVIGNENGQAFGSVFAQGNTKGGDTVRGATLGASSNGLSASITNAQTSMTDTFVKQAQANLRLDNSNTVSAQISQADTKIKGINFTPQQNLVRFKWRNHHGVGADITRDVNKGGSNTLTKSLSANLFENDKHRFDASVFNSNVEQANGFRFDRTGGVLDYSHANGHGLNAGLSRFSGIGKQATLGGYTNLYTSNDGLTTFNANAGASRWLNGPFGGQNDFNFGLGLSHHGWRR